MRAPPLSQGEDAAGIQKSRYAALIEKVFFDRYKALAGADTRFASSSLIGYYPTQDSKRFGFQNQHRASSQPTRYRTSKHCLRGFATTGSLMYFLASQATLYRITCERPFRELGKLRSTNSMSESTRMAENTSCLCRQRGEKINCPPCRRGRILNFARANFPITSAVQSRRNFWMAALSLCLSCPKKMMRFSWWQKSTTGLGNR